MSYGPIVEFYLLYQLESQYISNFISGSPFIFRSFSIYVVLKWFVYDTKW